MVRFSMLFMASLALWAQDPRGTITGQVSDSSGALISGASVRVANIETGVATKASSNEQGRYEVPYLNPGTYKIDVEVAGFKAWNRGGIDLHMGDRVQIDIQMELGNVAETVEVTAQAPVLENTSASVSQTMDSRQTADLPLRSGSLAWLFSTAPGVSLPTLPFDGPWNVDQSSNLAIGGSKQTVDFNLDGVSNNAAGGQTAFVPPAEMVQEVRIETTSYDAAVGHTPSGAINISLKTGTNALHGTLGTSVSSGPMMTRNFFTDGFIFDPTTGPITPEKIKANTPSIRWVRYTAVIGGPLYIPKVYDGRNKTFFMFGYQRHNRKRPNSSFNTVPTAAERNGDFSELLALGSRYQIYDPFTTQRSGSTRFVRQPLPGNIIPASRIDPTARKILKYFPLSNTAGTYDGLQNYQNTSKDVQNLSQPSTRVDHNFNERHRMYGRYSHSDFEGNFDRFIPGSDVRGRTATRPYRGVALDDVHVLSSTMVLDVRYGFTWLKNTVSFANRGWDLNEFFPSSLVSQLDPQSITFPLVSVNGMLPLGNNAGNATSNYSHSWLGVLNWMKGAHSIKSGVDFRLIRENVYTFGNVSPQLTFDATYTKGPLDNSVAAPTGQPFASFLFGIPTGGIVDINASRAESSRLWAGFVQDDWRISNKLTLNLGLRWEYESPIVERYNRSSRDFDFVTVNPIQAQAQALYAKAPFPQVPVAQFRTIGGLTFAGINGNPRELRDPYRRELMPRVGFAYQVKPRVVFRGGYGIFYSLLGADFSDATQPGFNQRTNIVSSLDNGMTYAASIGNPFPSGLQRPIGASGGLTTYLGRSPGFFSSDGRPSYTQRWSTAIQFQPMSQTVVELGYMGNKAARLRVDTEFDPVPRQYLSTSPKRDQATIDLLSSRVANPFVGIDGFAGSNLYSVANTQLSQLLKAYPQFQSLVTGLPAGSSWYHALTARVERRFSKGLQLQANYTWSKTMEATEYLNDTDSIPTHVVSALDRPHRIVATGIYSLPFGAGRRIAGSAHGILNHIIGGWQTSIIYQYQSGPPLNFGNVIFTGSSYADLKLPGGHRRPLNQWFNTSLFVTDSAQQLANNIRTFPLRLSAVRADGLNMWDASLHKNFSIREGLKLQLRGDVESLGNHPTFDPPNTAPTSSLFGKVSGTSTNQEERRVFVGLKLLF